MVGVVLYHLIVATLVIHIKELCHEIESLGYVSARDGMIPHPRKAFTIFTLREFKNFNKYIGSLAWYTYNCKISITLTR